MEQYIGKRGTITMKGEREVDTIIIEVKVLNAKQSYGRNRFLVTPVAGSGEVWKENVTFKK
jgi:hypothetical protein